MTPLERKNRFVAAMAIMLVGSMAIFGAVAVDTAAATHSNTTQLNETLTVTNDTQSIWVDATDTNGTDLHVTIEGIDADGNVTELKTATFNSGENTTNSTSYELTDSDLSKFDQVRITLVGPEVASTNYGSIVEVSGGGTASGGGSFLTDRTAGFANWLIGLVAIVVMGFVYVGGKDD